MLALLGATESALEQHIPRRFLYRKRNRYRVGHHEGCDHPLATFLARISKEHKYNPLS